MKRPTAFSKLDTKPAIATWELWSLAQMLIATFGDGAESHAQAKLAEAESQGNEAEEIVWSGVISHLGRLRED